MRPSLALRRTTKVPMPTSSQIRFTVMRSLAVGATKSATSQLSGNLNGPEFSSLNSSFILAANCLFFFFFPFDPAPMPFIPFIEAFFIFDPLDILVIRHSAPRSPFHLIRAASAKFPSLNTQAMLSPPTGWNISTNNLPNSRSDVSNKFFVIPLLLSSSPMADASFPPRFLACPEFFSTPNFVPTGNSTSMRESLFSSPFCTAARH
mmetsp:Transcript_28101/g.43054  ORF Transcript_28101/g.43054 Transcript_28101/m.43054 type:complete len:206 (-) Transcript_28101:276-893(-)